MGDRRLHFGVVLSTVEQPIQSIIWQSIAQYADKNNIHLTAYYGSYESQYHGDYHNMENESSLHYETCFETIKRSNLDGLLLFSGFIVQSIGLESFHKYLNEIPSHIPVVSISYLVPDMTSVLINNIERIRHVLGKKIAYGRR